MARRLSSTCPHAPLEAEARGSDDAAAAGEVDRRLRRLGGQEARCRHVLGRLAHELLARQAFQQLGFARLGDYTRERLGLSAREIQITAQVARALDQLPVLAAAFQAGEITWTHARLLAPVATRANAADWVALARGRSVRALEACVRARAGGAASAEQAGETPAAQVARPLQAIAACDEAAGLLEGEPEVEIRLPCPRRLRALWRAVVELARRVAGAPLSAWQCAELIAAEGMSAPPPQLHAVEAQHAARGPRTIQAPHAVQVSDYASPYARERARAALVQIDSPRRARRSASRRSSDVRSLPPTLDWSPLADVLPGSVEDLARDGARLDAFALDARLREVLGAMHGIDWQMGRLLRLLVDGRLYCTLGFPGIEPYVRERLGISPRKARALVAVERAAARAPRLAEAWREGGISWLRALTIAPVLSAPHEAAWVARAGEVTVRRLVDEVGHALTVQDLRLAPIPVPRPHGAGLSTSDRQMRAHLEGAATRPDDAAAPPSGQCSPRPGDGETIDAEIRFRGPASVGGLFRDAVAAFCAPGEPAWRGCERLLAHVVAEWGRQPRHRDPVFARDGWRCSVPACSARRNLHDHHILFRSRGGGNAPENRVTVCAWHHLRGIHAGGVHAWGKAPDAIYWDLGVRPGRRPLLRLLGERYVNARV